MLIINSRWRRRDVTAGLFFNILRPQVWFFCRHHLVCVKPHSLLEPLVVIWGTAVLALCVAAWYLTLLNFSCWRLEVKMADSLTAAAQEVTECHGSCCVDLWRCTDAIFLLPASNRDTIRGYGWGILLQYSSWLMVLGSFLQVFRRFHSNKHGVKQMLVCADGTPDFFGWSTDFILWLIYCKNDPILSFGWKNLLNFVRITNLLRGQRCNLWRSRCFLWVPHWTCLCSPDK